MKYLIFLFLLISTMMISSCDSEQSLRAKYIKECAEGKFEDARVTAGKLEAINSWQGNNAIKYINDKEIYLLLAKPSKENDSRILFLYNSFEERQLPDMEDVLQVAISSGNESLSEKLIKAGVPISILATKMAMAEDMNEVVNSSISRNPQYIIDSEIAEYYKEENGSDKYLELLQKQLLNIIDVPARPAIGVISGGTVYIGGDYEKYKEKTDDLNILCKKIIIEAVNLGKYDVANKTLLLMKPNIEWVFIKGDKWKVTENRTEINEAKQIIQSGKH